MSSANSDAFAITRRLDLGGDGLRVVVKECLDIAGLANRSGSATLETAAPAKSHATVIQSVLDRGCRIIGLANMHELAFGVTGVNHYLGTPRNPRWTDRIPGGSSSGPAVAVAAGLCDFSIGTDTGGSIRQPACCCGIYGLKPTFGRISRHGASPAESSLDCIGPLAATATMLTSAMAAMDPTFVTESVRQTPKLRRLRPPVDPLIDAAVDHAVETSGIRISECSNSLGLDEAYHAAIVIINREMARAFGHLAVNAPVMGEDVRARILAAMKTDDGAVNDAEMVRLRFRAAVDKALDGVDALVIPVLPSIPPTLDEARNPENLLPLTRLLRPYNLSGHPALTIPVTAGDGMPAGLQLVGRAGEDAKLCAIAGLMEGSRDWT